MRWINMEWKDANRLCVFIFFKYMGCYLVVIGKLHNNECLIHIFTGEVINDTPNIFNKSKYYGWYKDIRNHFSPVLINTTHKNVHFFNQIKGNIPRSGTIDQKNDKSSLILLSVL